MSTVFFTETILQQVNCNVPICRQQTRVTAFNSSRILQRTTVIELKILISQFITNKFTKAFELYQIR